MKPEYSRDPGLDKLFAELAPAMFSAPVANDPYIDIDNLRPRPNDVSMTDLTRQEVDAKLGASEAKVDARLASFDASIKTGFADMRSEFSAMRADFAKMQTDGHKGTIDLFKWGTALLVSLASVTVAIIVFIVNTALKAPQAPAQQASSAAAATQPASQAPVTAAPPASAPQALPK